LSATLKRAVRKLLHRTGLLPLYFRAVVWRLARGRDAPPEEDNNGVAIPPLNLMAMTVAHADWRAFLRTGETTAKALDKHAIDAGLSFADAGCILDFGCGAGRVIRHLPPLTDAELFGADYNETLLKWCAANLPGKFSRNDLAPPLDFPDAHFDIIYALSVFTHLREDTQRQWLGEFARMLRRGGLVLISFHEETQPGYPQTQEAHKAISSCGYYVHNDMAEGSNLIAVFQTDDHARRLFAETFEIVKMVSRTDAGIGQSLAVLRKSMAVGQ
jgi:SAM-dependent methyltransferase